MTLRVSARTGDTITTCLASHLGFGEEIKVIELEEARNAAFSSTTPSDFAWHYLRSECFSKFAAGSDPSLAEEALRGFRLAEAWCNRVNERLVDPWTRPWLDVGSLRRARHACAAVLGRFPWERFPAVCEWSSGASTCLIRRRSQIQNKWDLSSHITTKAIPYFSAFARWAGIGGIERDLIVVNENKVTTVPKSYKTDRTIAIEPDWNMFFQKGLGSLIRARLQRFGLLRPDAQFIARRMARSGSIDGRLATIDLSAASDSVSLALCELLLPEDWLRPILDLRSTGYRTDDGTVVPYAKVSSMGNGYTFELETLLFYAITCAVSGLRNENVHVYGDDIICPTNDAADVAGVLFECGFFLNDDKSFLEGPFRESCGGHYFEGTDVTPFYLRKPVAHAGNAISLSNHIAEWTYRFPKFSESFTKVQSVLRSCVPRKYWGPWGVDGTLWSTWDSARPEWSAQFQAFRLRRLTPLYEVQDDTFPMKWGGVLQALWSGTARWHGLSEYRVPLEGRFRASTYYLCRTQWSEPTVR